MKIFSAQLKGTTTVATGANVSLTGSFSGSIAGIDINSTNTFTSSTSVRLNSIETISASNVARISSLEITSASVDTLNTTQNSRLDSLETTSASVDTLNTTQNTRLTNLEEKTGSLATTGSNTFYGQQVFSGSLYVRDNLIVQGSSSLQNITASAVSIGTNIVYLNTDTPSVRYAGLTVQDSGSSAGVTGSMLWDSLCNRWIYSNPSTVGYSGGMLISGPRASTLGTETTLTCNYIAKSGGGDHLYDSCIVDDGTSVTINGNLKGTATACFTSAVCSCASTTLYAYFDGSNTVLPNPTDRPHIFRLANGGLGLSANNEGVGSQPIRIYTCGTERLTILGNGSVGIGTNTPVAYSNYTYLHIAGKSTTMGGNVYLTTSDSSHVTEMYVDSSGFYLTNSSATPTIFKTNAVERFKIAANGVACFACDLTAKTIGTNDLKLSNLNYECANYVDGTRGSWLIQEGQDDLFIINQISCKKYKFNLIEIE